MALTDRVVKQARKAGVLIDGGGLRLRVSVRETNGKAVVRKSWVLRLTVKGSGVREGGLGSARDVSLAEAREKATEMRRLAREGIDPFAHRDAQRAARAAEASRRTTFREAAETYVAAHESVWRNAKHRQQWHNTLKSYVYPVFGEAAVHEVDVALVMKAVEPLWRKTPETASRVRQRIEAVLDAAAARGLRSGENPARWRGHLQKLLPARSKVAPVKHHPALAYTDLLAFMAELREQGGDGARALELTILTAARSGEVLGARWDEIDFKAKVWTVPPERMKAGREHRVPLSADALAVLKTMRESYPRSAYVFPGAKPGKPLSNMAMAMTLRRMGRDDLTVHGFRSTFRDWAAERTAFARETAEAALAHVVADKVEAAYRRGDLFAKRRKLMDAWASYCRAKHASGEVVALRSNQPRR